MNPVPTATSWLRRHAVERRDKPAVVDGDETWTWGELDRLASAAEQHWPSGRPLALVSAPTAAAIAVVHAALRSPLELVVLNPRAAGAELEALVAASDAGLVATDPASAEKLSALLPAPVVTIDDLVSGRAIQPDLAPGAAAAEHARTDDVISQAGEVIVPTSGTTGPARLARLPVANLAASQAAWSSVLPPATGWLLSLGLAHVAGLGIAIRAAAAGAPVVVPGNVDANGILDAIRDAAADGVAVSHLSLVAVQLERILDLVGDDPPPPSVRAVLLGGGPIPPAIVTRALRAGWPVIPTYGLTETASGVTALPTDEAGDAPWSAGRPLPGVELRACDPSDPESVPLTPGVIGELRIRGQMVFAGYLGDAEATAAALGPDGWLRTGDLGRIDELGRLEVIDRIDDLIVSGGENVTPAEVEAVLAEHPDVADVGVIGVADPTWGRVPVAVVVAREGYDVDAEGLRAFARQRLASFKVPARIIVVDVIPRSSSGKLLRRRIAPIVEGES